MKFFRAKYALNVCTVVFGSALVLVSGYCLADAEFDGANCEENEACSQCFPGIGNEGEAGCGAGEHRCKAYGGGSGTITYMVCVNSSSSESECDPESTEEGEEEKCTGMDKYHCGCVGGTEACECGYSGTVIKTVTVTMNITCT